MAKRVAINGFGRIGRMVFRRMIVQDDLEVVAVNASYPAETLAHLVKYDTIHGKFPYYVDYGEDYLLVNGKKVLLTNNRNPEQLPWKELEIDIVVEATGKFNARDKAALHLTAGAKKLF